MHILHILKTPTMSNNILPLDSLSLGASPSIEDMTANSFFRPGVQKNLVYDWYIRNKIRLVVEKHPRDQLVIKEGMSAPPLTRQLMKLIWLNLSSSPSFGDEERTILYQKAFFSLGLKLESNLTTANIPTNYFDTNNIKSRLPFGKNNSCFCDSVIAAMLHCNIHLINFISTFPPFRNINGKEVDSIYTYTNDDPLEYLQIFATYLGIDLKFYSIKKGEKDVQVCFVNNFPEKEAFSQAKTFIRLNATRKFFLKLVRSKTSAESTTLMSNIRDNFVDMEIVDDSLSQEDAGEFYENVIEYGYFYRVVSAAFLEETRQKNINSINETLYRTISGSETRGTLIINTNEIDQSISEFQDMFNYKVNNWVYDAERKWNQKYEIMFPMSFIGVKLNRFIQSWVNNQVVVHRDTRKISFSETITYKVNRFEKKMEICAFIIKTGSPTVGHYTCYFKTDNGDEAQWYYYNDSGPSLDETIWEDMQKPDLDGQKSLQNATLLFLREIPRPQSPRLTSLNPKQKKTITLVYEDSSVLNDVKRMLDEFKKTYFKEVNINFILQKDKKYTDVTNSDIIGYVAFATGRPGDIVKNEHYINFKKRVTKEKICLLMFRKNQFAISSLPGDKTYFFSHYDEALQGSDLNKQNFQALIKWYNEIK